MATKRKLRLDPPKTQEETKELVRQALRVMTRIEDLKAAYKQLDELTDQLVERGFTEMTLGRRRVVLKDNFATKNTVWRSTPHRRYELELT